VLVMGSLVSLRSSAGSSSSSSSSKTSTHMSCGC
jgi:hypothetical protein